MDAKSQQRIVELINAVVGPVMGEYVKELRALRRELDHAKREITLMKIRSGQRALVRSVRHE